MAKPPRYRPDHDGTHRKQYERNKKIVFATQSFCAICGRPVDFKLKFPDPYSPTVDHIVPINKGGHPSALDNLQLAHFRCNRLKGDTPRERAKPKKVSNRALELSADWKTY